MNIDFSKYPDGLVPAIVQDALTKTVLMLGYMNADAVAKTQASQQVTFYSRSKNRLWTKGEESGNVLELVSIRATILAHRRMLESNEMQPSGCARGHPRL